MRPRYEDPYARAGRRLYKDSLHGKICGIFAGLGEYLGVNAALLRILGLIAIFVAGPMVILGYFLLALLLTDRPCRWEG